MESRQSKLLQHIVEEYIATAQPVGSSLIAEKYMKDISSPTVRNEMQELERLGYIRAPHTSAGRIPTEKGYRFYIENILANKELSVKRQDALSEIIKTSDEFEEGIKFLAKKTAELANEAVLIAFSPNNVYHTGLANVFSKPEFMSHDLVLSLLQVFDHLDETMAQVHPDSNDEVSILLGSENPFGDECGSIVATFEFNHQRAMISILGPMRMDYAENIAYVKFIKRLLEK